jgi:hypothetical protein
LRRSNIAKVLGIPKNFASFALASWSFEANLRAL